MENVLWDMLKKYCQVSSKHKTLKPVFPALEKKKYIMAAQRIATSSQMLSNVH